MINNQKHHMNKRHFRDGSVLIMVVALLVLLALMGTAWIATSQQDRDASVANIANAQVSSKLDGIPATLVDQIIKGMFATPSDYKNGADGLIGTPDDTARLTAFFMPRNTIYERYNTTSDVSYMFDFSVINTPDADVQVFPGFRPSPAQLIQNQFLAARTPTWSYNVADANMFNRPIWPAISAPLISPMPQAPGAVVNPPTNFPSVMMLWDDTGNKSMFSSTSYLSLLNSTRFFENPLNGFIYTQRNNVIPSFDADLNPIFILEEGKKVLAADTDGDGIADAGFARLPVAEADGTTYFYATRIIDANSALNISVAAAPFENYDYVAKRVVVQGRPPVAVIPNDTDLKNFHWKYNTPEGNFFPSNLDLLSHLRGQVKLDSTGKVVTDANDKPIFIPTDELESLFSFRQSWRSWAIPVSYDPYQATTDLGDLVMDFQGKPVRFKTPWELFWRQIGTRTNFPAAIPNQKGYERYQSFPESDDVLFLKHFLLPPTNLARAGVIGKVIPDSILYSSRPENQKFTPYIDYADGSEREKAALNDWYARNFKLCDWPANTGKPLVDNIDYSRLPLFVTRNGTSNAAPLVDFRTVAPSFIGVNTPPALSPVDYDFPVKANINTADFNHLWNAFWHVMAEDTRPETLSFNPVAASPAGNPGDTSPFSFMPPSMRDSIPAYIDPIYANNNRARMFRSSIRATEDPTNADRLNSADPANLAIYKGHRFLPQQMVMLRSAIAAVNAMQMRTHVDYARAGLTYVETPPFNAKNMKHASYVAEPAITLPLASGAIASVDIYGARPQPVIGEIYIDNNGVTEYGGPNKTNTQGYVAIALFNPYPEAIDLSCWKLVAARRDPVSAIGLISGGAVLNPYDGGKNALSGVVIAPAAGLFWKTMTRPETKPAET